MNAHIRIRIDKNLSEAQLAQVLLNVCEHIAQERDYWMDQGIIDSHDQLEPIVLPVTLMENLHKDVNRNIREGYCFSNEDEAPEIENEESLIEDALKLLEETPNLSTASAVMHVLVENNVPAYPGTVNQLVQIIQNVKEKRQGDADASD